MVEPDYRGMLLRVLGSLQLERGEDGEWHWDCFNDQPAEVLTADELAWWEPGSKRHLLKAKIAHQQAWVAQRVAGLADMRAQLVALDDA